MRLTLFTTLLAAAFTVTGSAVPGHDKSKSQRSNNKISQAEAEAFVNKFWRFMQTGRRDIANDILTSDVKGYSASTFSINGSDPPPRGTPWMETIDGFIARNGYLDEQSTKYDFFIAVGTGKHEKDIFWAYTAENIPPGRSTPSNVHVCFSMRKVNGKWKCWRESWEYDNIAWAKNYVASVNRTSSSDDSRGID